MCCGQLSGLDYQSIVCASNCLPLVHETEIETETLASSCCKIKSMNYSAEWHVVRQRCVCTARFSFNFFQISTLRHGDDCCGVGLATHVDSGLREFTVNVILQTNSSCFSILLPALQQALQGSLPLKSDAAQAACQASKAGATLWHPKWL
jgi:hypothetical protein